MQFVPIPLKPVHTAAEQKIMDDHAKMMADIQALCPPGASVRFGPPGKNGLTPDTIHFEFNFDGWSEKKIQRFKRRMDKTWKPTATKSQ